MPLLSSSSSSLPASFPNNQYLNDDDRDDRERGIRLIKRKSTRRDLHTDTFPDPREI